MQPIQRLPRYELLLKDLLKHIPESQREVQAGVSKLLDTVVDINKVGVVLGCGRGLSSEMSRV